MSRRKRIVRKVVEDTRAPRTTLETIQERIDAKKSEYARMIAIDKGLSLARAYNEVTMKVNLALNDKGVKLIDPFH